MQRWSFRGLLLLVTVGLVLATVGALELSTYSQLRRLSREEARARAAREVARVLERFESRTAAGTSPTAVQAEIAAWHAGRRETSIAVRLILASEAEARFAEERAQLWRAAFAGGAVDAILQSTLDAVAAAPMHGGGGEIVAVVEAAIPAAVVREPLQRFVARTLRTGFFIVGLQSCSDSCWVAGWRSRSPSSPGGRQSSAGCSDVAGAARRRARDPRPGFDAGADAAELRRRRGRARA
jgi:hypothetical protein